MAPQQDPTIAGRRILGFFFLLVGIGLFLAAGSRSFTVYYAKAVDTDGGNGIEADNMQSIAGAGESRWGPDRSKQDTLRSPKMIEHATTGGVARTEGVLHLTGANACPT